jgi:transposase
MNVATLVPDPGQLQLECIVPTAEAITLTVRTSQSCAACPDCGGCSARMHSRYQRQIADLPWHGIPVRLRLMCRRFFCDRPDCTRRIFTERLPGVVGRYARKTDRLSAALLVIGNLLGGEAGARLGEELGMRTSPDSFLRHVRRAAVSTAETPRVLGIDDFAFRRGQHYGTILVDLERRRPIDLLPDRHAETVAQWLREHPGVEIVTRDRSFEYARGITTGASEATQVTDRFHLLANMREMLERVVDRNRHLLWGIEIPPPVSKTDSAAPIPGAVSRPRQPAKRSTREEAAGKTRQERRMQVRQEVHARHAAGENILQIAAGLGLARTTVYRYLRQQPASGSSRTRFVASMIDPFLPYLCQRWAEGCRNGKQLWRELRDRGYPGSRKMVAVWAAHQREASAPSTPKRYLNWDVGTPQPGDQPARASPLRLASSRQITWFLLRKPKGLTPAEQAAREQIHVAAPELALVQPLVLEFGRLVRKRDAAAFASWRERALGSGIADLGGFIAGLDKDDQAVLEALRSPWSNGWVEGQVNRLKLIKRQMYGRANFDLLRARVLATA